MPHLDGIVVLRHQKGCWIAESLTVWIVTHIRKLKEDNT